MRMGGRSQSGVGRGALVCSPEDGRGKHSPPALPEGRMQMSAIEAQQVRQAVRGNLIHSDKDRLCGGGESRSVGLVPCFHSTLDLGPQIANMWPNKRSVI